MLRHEEDLTPKEYALGKWEQTTFNQYTKDHDQGTIIYFENIKEGIKHSLDFLKKIIALYFRFSLLDKDFNIFIGDDVITHECLDDLASKTQFLWIINDLHDPYIKNLQEKFVPKEEKQLNIEGNIEGFIASVEKPLCLMLVAQPDRSAIRATARYGRPNPRPSRVFLNATDRLGLADEAFVPANRNCSCTW